MDAFIATPVHQLAQCTEAGCLVEEVEMGTRKMRDILKKQRRRKELRALKIRLAETAAAKERTRLPEKLKQISLNPHRETPDS